MKYFLGIDTSNYRTSAAICDENEVPIKNVRRLLYVKDGERGLRQSDALFSHVKALPEIMKEIGAFPLHAVGYSKTPRDCEGSYMPCFLAGEAVATGISELLGVPLYPFSHQAGHLSAAIYSCNNPKVSESDISANDAAPKDVANGKISEDGKFIAFHLSGGTTEALLYDNGKITLLGGTLDINAGQLIDRVGVAMGMGFPCGEEMERLAEGIPTVKGIKICVKGLKCNLSGIENQAIDRLRKGGSHAEVSAFTLDAVLKTLDKLTENVREAYPDLPILYAGGVMSCKRLQKALGKRKKCYFATPELSGDNAVGTALLTLEQATKTE